MGTMEWHLLSDVGVFLFFEGIMFIAVVLQFDRLLSGSKDTTQYDWIVGTCLVMVFVGNSYVLVSRAASLLFAIFS